MCGFDASADRSFKVSSNVYNLPENSLHREANGQDALSKIKAGIVLYKSINGDANVNFT